MSTGVSQQHLTAEQKVDVAKTLKERHPEWTVIKIVKMLHMDNTKLGVQLDDFGKLDTVEGEDGKQYPASNEAAEQKREAIRDEITEHPEKSDREIAKKTGTSPTTVGT